MLYCDTSFIVPYFVDEAKSRAVDVFLLGRKTTAATVSQWTTTEFHSALAMKLRLGELAPSAQPQVLARYRQTLAEHFQVLPVTPADQLLATTYLDEWKLGLRTGDALHLAIARNAGAEYVCTLDARMLKAARHFGIPTQTV